ncbi:hypothetical protein [Mucilaginibacter terrae]|uniref:Nuclear transport factor 2 family protein n=1 Tax=Mucilaginibacter terrae TaxID=1955052 RepID=A0ABU3GSG9_9SPHI|nr:hypothetical protein [Mucilaginibacter terrae]MDT3402724.1 hypothetical protein [Mucilaginibacter terrae]
MAEKLEFNCTQDLLQNLINGNTPIADFLNNLFADPEKRSQMCSALQAYHRNDGGSPEVHAFEVANPSFDVASLTGRFRCRFQIDYFFTCSDLRNVGADTIDWDFKIENNTLYLTGETVLERDGDEF